MRKWIIDKLSSDELWLSYFPNIFILALNAGMLAGNLYRPIELEWLANVLILSGSIGIAWSIRGLYQVYCNRQEIYQRRREMDLFMQSLTPTIQRILDEEMTVEGRDDEEAMREAQRKIQELIQSESDRRKIGLRVANSDKP